MELTPIWCCTKGQRILNLKMTKALTLFLLISILLLNLSSGLPAAPCNSKTAMEKMPCCSKIATAGATTAVKISKPSCCCKFSKDSSPATARPVDLINLNFKSSEGDALKVQASVNGDFDVKQTNPFIGNFCLESKFLINSKIFSFVSSYLI